MENGESMKNVKYCINEKQKKAKVEWSRVMNISSEEAIKTETYTFSICICNLSHVAPAG